MEYVLGLNAFCCDVALVTISVDTRFNSSHSQKCTPGHNVAEKQSDTSQGTEIIVIVGARNYFGVMI
jgi:hypothetical protein